MACILGLLIVWENDCWKKSKRKNTESNLFMLAGLVNNGGNWIYKYTKTTPFSSIPLLCRNSFPI
jgi:hypothetical protein